MKIIATTRTRNEEANIERFCKAYGTFCDEIIIVDGGSEDRTVEIAESMPKTSVEYFDVKVWNEAKTHWRNPHGEHINFCIGLALEQGADWIIFDDCDDVPTVSLQEEARNILTSTDKISVFAYRLYVYGSDRYFPSMNKPGQSLWAWRTTECMIWADENDPWKHNMYVPDREDRYNLDYPYSLLHYFAPDEETVQKKLSFYRESGQHPTMGHPTKTSGQLVGLPGWAVWK